MAKRVVRDRTPQPKTPEKLDYLGHLGPHRIAAGNLDVVGIPGLIFAPRSGANLPVVAFAHGWMQPVERYVQTLKHLASWGMIVVAPATERGLVPSHSALAADLSRTLRAIVERTLGDGAVSGSPGRLGVLGHSIGGGAAVLAAAADEAIGAVMTVTAVATEQGLRAAPRVRVPGLHLIGDEDATGGAQENAGRSFAEHWGGPVQLRTVKGARHLGLGEGRHWSTFVTGNGTEKRIQAATRTLAAAFFLHALADQEDLEKVLRDKVSGTTVVDLDATGD